MADRSSMSPHQHTIPGVGNRRTLERFKHHTEIFIKPFDGHYPARWVTSADVTHRGIFIRTGTGYPLDLLMTLEIVTLHGCIEVTGQVVHRIDGVGFGCRFVDMSEQSRADLSFLVSNYYAAPPTQRKIN